MGSLMEILVRYMFVYESVSACTFCKCSESLEWIKALRYCSMGSHWIYYSLWHHYMLHAPCSKTWSKGLVCCSHPLSRKYLRRQWEEKSWMLTVVWLDMYVHIYKERLETHVFFSNAQDKFILRETIKADPILSCLILSYVSYPFLSYPVVHNLDGQWEQSGYLSFAWP